MGKKTSSKSSCFKFIACCSASALEDDSIEPPAQVKASGEKHCWSFKKRSARNRVLSNNLTSENLTIGTKETIQSTSIGTEIPKFPLDISEKSDEKQQPPTPFELNPPSSIQSQLSETCVSDVESIKLVESEVPKTIATSAMESTKPAETKIFEEVAVHEPHVSTELGPTKTILSSQDDHLEEPMIIVIQTGVRRFLAQRELLKLRSTIKLQAAIRGYLVRRQAVDTLYCMQGIVKVQQLVRDRSSKLMGDGISMAKPITPKSSTKELLKNAFARQLMESTPKSKSTTTKCDPLKPNSAWTWLEMWMGVSSSRLVKSKTSEVMEEDIQSQAEKFSSIMECEDLSKVETESINSKYAVEEDSKTCSDPDGAYQPSKSLSTEEKMELIHDSTNESFEELLEMPAQNNQNSDSRAQSDSLSSNLTLETQESELPTKITSSEQADVEDSKSGYGSRRASNPTFIAAQSKFEVLSSAANSSNASLKSPRQDAGVESHPNTTSSLEKSSSEAFIPIEKRINIGGSECGTELSVTSTLDSPDHEDRVYEMELKTEYLEHLEVKANGHSNIFASTEDSKPIVVADSNEQEAIALDEHDNGEYVVLNMVSDSAQATPSSQVSAKTKKNKANKSMSNKKHSSNSAGKRTIVKSHQDSGVRSKGEQLPKDQKSGKRRKSFGSTKADNVDQERRDSTSSTKAVPSYMQATKSAKAKANSPRSSPDVQEKDGYIIKKRHSLPSAGGKHASHSPQPQTVYTHPQSG